MTIKITNEDFSVTEIVEKMKTPEVGCVVNFVGTVRNSSGSNSTFCSPYRVSEQNKTEIDTRRPEQPQGLLATVESLEIEAYPEMAKKELAKLATSAKKQFEITDVSVIHRIGKLNVTENIVCIAVSASHRKSAFKACEWLIDELKKCVPIWKTENFRE